MTEKQKRFAEEYMRTGNSRQAYINAGYSYSKPSVDVNASRLLHSDKVQKYMAEISDQIRSEKIAGIEEIQIKLSDIVRGLSLEQIVVTEFIGEGKSKSIVIEKAPALKDVIRAAEILAKMQGAYDNSFNINMIVPIFSGANDLED